MTISEKVNLINENPNLAFNKLVKNKEQNKIFLNFKKGYEANIKVYTTKLDSEATSNALEEMVMKGLI